MPPLDLQEFHLALPPTQDDLPYDDGVPMESQRHKLQMDLLIDALIPWLDAREDGYVGGNMFIYYSLKQVRNQDFRGPDVFVVLNVPKGERKSWVCWEEGKTPDVVIELLSVSTQDADKGEKKEIYQNKMRVAEYFWYDPFNPDDWAGFQLQGTYQPIAVNPQGQLVSQVLNLGLVRWSGSYQGVSTTWLRWVNLDGTLLPTTTEQAQQQAEQAQQQAEQAQQQAEQAQQQAEQAQQQAEQAQQQAEQAQQQAELAQQQANQAEQRANHAEQQVLQIVQNLRQTGMSTDQIAQITGLSPDQVTALDGR